jgi:hypothetical protein
MRLSNRARAHFSALLLGLALVGALSQAVGCGGGAVSVLQTKTKPTGQGMAELALVNSSGTTVAQLYVAPSESVDRAREAGAQPGSEADKTLWGADQLGNASIGEGSTWQALQLPPALYDVLLS